MAKLQTKNKQAVYNSLKAELYDNINEIMREGYKRMIEAQNQLLDEDSPTFMGNLLGGTVGFLGATAFDVVGGAIGGIGNAVTGSIQAVANFTDNVGTIFDESDGRGWQEDLAYTLASVPSNIIKGIGSASLGLVGFGGELFGIEGSAEFAQEKTRNLEDYVNVNIVGAAVEEARTGNMLSRVGAQFLLGDTPEGMGRQDVESEFDDAEYVKQYIDDRFDPTTASAQVKKAMTSTNQWWQSNISEPIKDVLDGYVGKSFAGGLYSKYVEPAAQSIGEIIPAMIISAKGQRAGTEEIANVFNNLSKAYFVSNVYGRSYQEAVNQGATNADAHIYGIGNAGLELGTEMIGGFVPGQPLATSYKSVLKSMGTEALEELMAEVAQPGLNFWLDKERKVEDIEPSELRQRALYSALVGSISGGVFGSIGKRMSQSSPEANIQALNKEFEKNVDKRNDQVISQQISNLERNLNDPNIPQWRKNQILNNPFYQQVVQENTQAGQLEQRFNLTEVGKRMARGEILSKQGDTTISKDEYAIGSQEFFSDYLESNEFGDIQILKNEEVETLPQKQQEDIKWFQNRGLRVAFVKQEAMPDGTQADAYTDLNTGMIYVNVNSKNNEAGFKNAFAHEMADKMQELYQGGVLTQRQFDAYQGFVNSIEDGELDTILEQVGWNDVAEVYARQLFTPEQEAQANENGWESVELTSEQKRIIAREKISKVIDSVFDNETILRRAFGEKPNIFRRIANIFANTQKFEEQFNIKDGALKDMLTNMQTNFQKLLKESSEFAFGAETIAQGLLQRKIYSPNDLFTNNAYKQSVHKATYWVDDQVDLALITRNEEAMMSIVGYDPNFDMEKDYKAIADVKKKQDQEYFIRNKPQLIDGTPEQAYYDTFEGKDYFFKVGRKLYDRNKFQIPEGATNVRVSFVDNNYFELAFDYQPNFESAEDAELQLEENFYKQKIYPDVEMSDGRVIEKPIILVSSLNEQRVEFMLQNKGLFSNQSINMQSATAMTLGSQEFEGVFIGENGHEFTITVVFKNDIIETPGFQAYKSDAFTPINIFPKSEVSDFDGPDLYDTYGVDPKKNLILKLDNYTIEKSWIHDGKYVEVPFNVKSKVLQTTLNIMAEQGRVDLNALVDTDFQESINKKLSDLIGILDKTSKINTTRYTKASLKARMNKQSHTPAEIFEMARKAAKSLYTVFNYSGLEEINRNSVVSVGQLIDFGLNDKARLTWQMNDKVVEVYKNLEQDMKNIIEYMSVAEYQIDNISEANHPKTQANMIGSAYITHYGENKNSAKYQKIKNFFEEQGALVQDIVNPRSIEQMKQDAQYDEAQGNFFNTSTWKYNHIDHANQSIIDQALEDDVEKGLNLTFKVSVNKDKNAQSQKNKENQKATKPVLQGSAEVSAQNNQEIENTQTPNTIDVMDANAQSKKSLTYSSILNAQNIAQQQTSEIYRQINKEFSDFQEDVYKEDITKEKAKEFKLIQAIFKKHEGIIKRDARGSKYVNHVTSAMLKTLIKEMSETYTKIKQDKSRKTFKLNASEIDNIINKVNEAIFGTVQYMNDITSKRYISSTNPMGMIYAKYSHWYLRDLLEADLSNQDTLKQFADEDSRGRFYRRLLNAIYNVNKAGGPQELDGAIDAFLKATDIEKVSDLSLREDDTQRTQSEVLRQWIENTKNIDDIKNSVKFQTLAPSTYASLIDPYSFLQIQGLFNDQSWASIMYKKMITAEENMIEIDRVFEEIIQTEQWLKENYKEIKKMESTRNAYEVKELGNIKMTLSQIIFLRDMIAREFMRNKAIEMGIIDGNQSQHFNDGNEIEILNLDNDYSLKSTIVSLVRPRVVSSRATINNAQNLLQELDNYILENDVAYEYNQKTQEFFSRLYPYINERYMEVNGQPLQNEGQEIAKAIDNMEDNQIDELFANVPKTINVDNIDKLYAPIYVGESGYFKDDSVNIQNIIDVGVFDGMTQSIGENVDSAVKVDSITNVLYKYKQEARNYYGMHRLMSDWNDVVNRNIGTEQQQTNLKKYIGPQAIDYVEKLLKDMAGYSSSSKSPAMKAWLGWARKNFYRAALAGNLKVIFTQLTTIYNLSMLYGDNPATFFPKMYKNLFMQLSEKNRELVNELKETNNIYYNRTYNPTFDMGEATTQGIDGNNAFNRLIRLMMSGISITDNAINKAFYLTLLETTNPQTNALYTKEEANALLNDGILRSQSSALDLSKAPLLRTDSDIIKVMVKFMGEPLKLQSQIYMAKKKLEYVKKVEKESGNIKNKLNQQETQSLSELGVELAKLKDLQDKENTPDFASLNEDQQKKIRKDIEKQQVIVNEKQKQHDEKVQSNESIKQQLDFAIASKTQTRIDMTRRIATLLGAMTYMAGLGVAWSLLLSDMGKLDDREEEEELLQYLTRKMGVQIGNEFAGLFPFVRDIYGLVVEGYDLASIDEFRVFQDTITIMTKIYKDTVDGEEMNPYEIARDISVFGLRTFGVPARNLEKIAILAMMATGNQDAYYRYRSLTGQRTASNKELARAVVDGNDDLVQAIVDTRIASREISVSDPVISEITNLARVGANVTMTSINDSYTIEGVEYTMTSEEKSRFRAIYNQADLIIQKMINSSAYNRLNDTNKASLLRSIYNYYLRLAQDTVLGVDVLPESRTFRTLNQVFAYFRDTITTSLYRQQQEERFVQ